MVRYKRGDRAAFAELVKRYQGRLFNFSLRYVRHRETAREVTQEAFLRAVRRSGDFKHESRFSTWMFAITRNLCIDHTRKSKHRRHQSIDDSGDDGQPILERLESPAADQNAERNVVSGELRAGILRAVDQLPDEQREVFLLRQLGNVPFSEIARITDTPVNTVKSRMRYALSHLKGELLKYEEYARALR